MAENITERILLVNDFYLGGGAEGVFRDSYAILKEAGVTVDLFFGSEKSIMPASAMQYLSNNKNKTALLEKLNAFQPSIIHIHNYYHYLTPAIFKAIRQYRKTTKVKVVLTAHDYHMVCPSSGMMFFKDGNVNNIDPKQNSIKNWLFAKIDHRGFKYSTIKKLQWLWDLKVINSLKEIDLIISPSEFLKKVFADSNINIPVAVIRNPLNLKVPENVAATKTSTNDIIKILFIGRLSQEKGLYDFLEAFAKSGISKQHNIQLDILGKGKEEDALKKLAEDYKLDNVKFHGFKQEKELEGFLANANVLLLPSVWYENAPLSIIEGAAYGNIVMVRNLGGMTEMAKLTTSYVLVDDWNTELPAVCEKLKTLGVNRIINTEAFSPETYRDSLIEQYKFNGN
jgi:glycosyltransferase involved in cell wall biosynthesis